MKQQWMERALELAERGRGRVLGNPLVGAVIVRKVDGDTEELVAQGWHRAWGGPHAEIEALADFDARFGSGASLCGCTMYVNLEPCCHQGKTPPCTEALIARGLETCVIAMVDPNPLVAGKGIDVLRRAGCRVECGLLEDRARTLNRGFIARMEKGRPWVSLKMAISLDGKIAAADGSSKWISNACARDEVMALRREHDAVLVGLGTWLADQPRLDVRQAGEVQPEKQDIAQVQPWRVILDPEGKSLESGSRSLDREHVDSPRKTLVISFPEHCMHSEDLPPGWEQVALAPRHGSGDRGGRFDSGALLAVLAQRGINSVLVEGGGQTLEGFLADGAYDQLRIYTAPIIIGSTGVPAFPASRGQTLDSAFVPGFLGVRTLGSNACFDLCKEVASCSPV